MQELIRKLNRENPLWGAEVIRLTLLNLQYDPAPRCGFAPPFTREDVAGCHGGAFEDALPHVHDDLYPGLRRIFCLCGFLRAMEVVLQVACRNRPEQPGKIHLCHVGIITADLPIGNLISRRPMGLAGGFAGRRGFPCPAFSRYAGLHFTGLSVKSLMVNPLTGSLREKRRTFRPLTSETSTG